MKLAELFEHLVGPATRRPVRRVRRQPRRARRRRRHARRSARRGALQLHRDRARRPRPGARLRHRRPRRRRRPVRGADGAAGASPAVELTWSRARSRCCASSAPASCGRPPRPAQEAPPPLRRGPPALQGARRRRDQPPLRRVEPLLRLRARARRWPTPARSTRRPDATLEEAQAEKFDLVCRKLGLQPGHAAARRRLRLGRHGACTPREHYGVRAIGVTLSRQQAEWGAARRSPSAGLAGPSPRSGSRTTATSPRPTSTPSRSIGLTEHIGLANLPSYFRVPRSHGCAPAAGC